MPRWNRQAELSLRAVARAVHMPQSRLWPHGTAGVRSVGPCTRVATAPPGAALPVVSLSAAVSLLIALASLSAHWHTCERPGPRSSPGVEE